MNPSHDLRHSAWTPRERLFRFYHAALLSSAALFGPACHRAPGEALPAPALSGSANVPFTADTALHPQGTEGRAPDYVMSFDDVKDCPSGPSTRKGFSKIGVEVTIQATCPRQVPVNVFYAALSDANGDVYSPTLAGCDPPLPAIIVSSDARATGYITFEVPMLSRRLELRYEPPVIGGTDEGLRFSVNR